MKESEVRGVKCNRPIFMHSGTNITVAFIESGRNGTSSDTWRKFIEGCSGNIGICTTLCIFEFLCLASNGTSIINYTILRNTLTFPIIGTISSNRIYWINEFSEKTEDITRSIWWYFTNSFWRIICTYARCTICCNQSTETDKFIFISTLRREGKLSKLCTKISFSRTTIYCLTRTTT